MEKLSNFFNIPPYYNDLKLEIKSNYLVKLFSENPIDYMRYLYKKDIELFYNVRDELILRGFGFKKEYQNNYLLDRPYEIQSVIYKENNTFAFNKIKFSMIGLNNFIERFKVDSDLFFKNMTLEGVLYFTHGISYSLLQDLFKEVGFSIILVKNYNAIPIHEDKTSKINDDIRNSDKSIECFFEDSIFTTFLDYCQENGIKKLSELNIDFVDKYQYEKHVRKDTAIKVMERYNEIEYNPLYDEINNVIDLFQNNSFKSLTEFADMDYLKIVDDFYEADGINIYIDSFSFKKLEKHSRNVVEKSLKLLSKKQNRKFEKLTKEIQYHSKFKYVLYNSLEEIQKMFKLKLDDSIDLELYVSEIIDDIKYKDVLIKILLKLNNIISVKRILIKISKELKTRDIKILELRQNNTLQEIGDEIGVSRERVRQIEEKVLRRLKRYRNQLNLKLYLNYLTENSKLLKLNDFMSLFEIEENTHKFLLKTMISIDDSILYLEGINSYISYEDYKIISKGMEKIDYSQPIIQLDELKELFGEEIFYNYNEVIDLLILSNKYNCTNNIYVKKTINIISRINYLFKNIIKEPLEMDDEGYEIFKQYMKNTFNVPYNSSKRASTARIIDGENVILVDGNTFALHEDKFITNDFLTKIEEILDEHLDNFEYVNPRWIFKDYSSLMKQAKLISPQHLYSIIQIYLGDKYETGSGNTLYIYKINAKQSSTEDILLNYLNSNNDEATKKAVIKNLKWPNFKLSELLYRSKKVILIGDNVIKTIKSFNFTNQELNELRKIIKEEMKKGYMFTMDFKFEIAFNENLKPLVERCKLTDDVTLVSIIKWLYPNIYGHLRLLYDSDGNIIKFEQVIAKEYPEFIRRSELIQYAESKGYSIQTINSLPSDILRDDLFYNYTKTKYINNKQLFFNDEVKLSLKKYLQEQFEMKLYCPIDSLSGYSKLTPMSSTHEWTKNLIGQFAEKLGYRKIQTNIDYRFDKPVLVKEDAPIENFEQLVFHIVKTEYKDKYHYENLANYLADKKIIHNPNRLAKEIRESKLFKFDSLGFFETRGEIDGTY